MFKPDTVFPSGDHQRFKDHKKEERLFRKRVAFSLLFLMTLIALLLFRFYDLQVKNFQSYATQSDRNRLQVRPIPPNRGLIFDVHGNVIAENRSVSALMMTKERIKNFEATVAALSEFISISEREIENYKKSLKWRRRPFEALPLKLNLTETELARFAVNEHLFDGVEVEGRLVRHYPYGELFTHVGGYVGRINERELNAFTPEHIDNYAGTDSIGKIGLEKYYEDMLHGTVGSEKIETDARGRVLRVVDQLDPIAGDDLNLFLDVVVQQRAVDAMAGRRGAVVAMEVETGGVSAFLSSPGYDPNLFVTGISTKNYRTLNESWELPLFNRAIQGQYPAGSTIKPLLALAGLEYGVVDESTTVSDPGFYQLENDERLYRDWKPEGHGQKVDLWQAVVESCDIYYYDLGFKMGVDRMHAFGSYFGLGQKTNIDIPSERSGLWPSREWKKRVRRLGWYPGNSLNMSIGQGDVLTTPLQLAAMTLAMARRGEFLEPQLVKSRQSSEGLVASEPRIRNIYKGDAEHWDAVLQAMRDVIHHPKGTAKVIAPGLPFTMAGKTGTAQVVSIAQDGEYDSEALSERNRDHALFVGYAPYENPLVAVAVVIENGEKSSEAAVVAREVIEAFIRQHELHTSTDISAPQVDEY